jgi:hypothetical protein
MQILFYKNYYRPCKQKKLYIFVHTNIGIYIEKHA